MLQWGRCLATAETSGHSLRQDARLRDASMGPLSCDSGNQSSRRRLARVQTRRFNGAAVLRQRKRRDDGSCRRCRDARFNGAAVLRQRKRRRSPRRIAREIAASMGPLSCDSGNRSRCERSRCRCYQLQWGRCLATAETAASRALTRHRRPRFNGAAVLRQRKRNCPRK